MSIDNFFLSQPACLIPWCLVTLLLMQAPKAGHTRHMDACGGKQIQRTKTTPLSFVQITSQLGKELLQEEEEPFASDTGNSTPTLDVAEVTSPVFRLLTKVVPPGLRLSSRILRVTPGKDSTSKPPVSASLYPGAAPRAQKSYQGRASSVGRALEYAADVHKADKNMGLTAMTRNGTRLLLKFTQACMLLHDHMILRLRQWRELAATVDQRGSAAVLTVLMGAALLIILLTFAVWTHAQANGRRSTQNDYPRSGQGRSFREQSQKGSVSKPTTPGLLTRKNLTPQRPQTTDLGRLSTLGQGPEEVEEYLDPDSYFCADLVVPAGCECILKVPTASLSQGPFHVTDVHDNAVLHIEPSALNVGHWTDAEQRGQHRLVLTTEFGTIMAQCGPSLTQARECDLLRAEGDHFAKITCAEEKAYTLTARTGLKLFFWGSIESYTMNVIDRSGRIVAKTGNISEIPASGETNSVATSQSLVEAPIYRVRVAPLMDVGLVLCGLLCIQHIM